MNNLLLVFIITLFCSNLFATTGQQTKDIVEDFISTIYPRTGYGAVPQSFEYDGNTFVVIDDHRTIHRDGATKADELKTSRSIIFFDDSQVRKGDDFDGLPVARIEIKADKWSAKTPYTFSNEGYIVIRDYSEYVVIPTDSIALCILQKTNECELNAQKFKFNIPADSNPTVSVSKQGIPTLTVNNNDNPQKLNFTERTSVEVQYENLRTEDSTELIEGKSHSAG